MFNLYFRMDQEIDIEEMVDKSLIKLYEKIPGYHFGFIGAIFGAISLILAYFLHITADPSYTIYTHFISHLGIGPNGSSLSFSIGLPLMSIFIYFYHIYEMRRLKYLRSIRNLFNLVVFGASLSLLGGIIAGIFSITNFLHIIGAIFYFLGYLLYYTGKFLYRILIEDNLNMDLTFDSIIIISYLSFPFTLMISFFDPKTIRVLSIHFFEWLTIILHLLIIILKSINIYKLGKLTKKSEKLEEYQISVNQRIQNRFYVVLEEYVLIKLYYKFFYSFFIFQHKLIFFLS
ncbi:MAG: hypothetical protein GF317_00670 [Candidatus Lokiarchaeota archaeon]|nr:hypothetical protein [Candidatus Lokiarchaeota archaeon]MBD3198482.1 hypothetical protein [Candidatus Lokiarchaeota archaeon]